MKTGFSAALCILLTLSFFSCSTPSPFIADGLSYHSQSEIPGEFIPQWAPFERGLMYLEGNISTPPLELRALRVDLSDPVLRVVINEPGPRPGLLPSIRTTSFARDYGCAAAINGGPFDPSGTREGEDREVVGIAVSGGRLISPPRPRYAALVFHRDGAPAVIEQAHIDGTENIEHALGGFFTVLKDGNPVSPPESRRELRFTRSAAGISADGAFLYLLTVTGSRASAKGATEEETGIILRQLGARDGLILDGGGSSALVLRFPDGSIRAVNKVSHNGISGRERAVATCLGIRIENGD